MEGKPDKAPAALRPLYLIAGLLAVGIGVAGAFLPLVPTVAPLLFAAWCFARSSERLYRWLLGHPRLGRIIAPFRAGDGMTRRAKAFAIAAMAVSFAVSLIWLLDGMVSRLILGAVAVVAFTFVLRLPTSTPGAGGDPPAA